MALIRARLGAASLRFTPGRVTSAPAGVTAGTIIREAYRLTPLELSPGPDWIYTDPFDLEAKAEAANEDQLRLMLRTLLAERFQLAMHRDSKVLPVYALRIGKKGAKLREWKTGDPMPGFNSKGHNNSFIERGTMQRLIRTMSALAGRPILDKTGLTGVYVFHVEWDEGQDFLAAMLKQLGLRLESQKAPIDIFTIDRIEQPSAN